MDIQYKIFNVLAIVVVIFIVLVSIFHYYVVQPPLALEDKKTLDSIKLYLADLNNQCKKYGSFQKYSFNDADPLLQKIYRDVTCVNGKPDACKGIVLLYYLNDKNFDAPGMPEPRCGNTWRLG